MAKEKVKKPFYKRWWVWLLALIIIGVATSGGEDTAEPTTTEPKTETSTPDTAKKKEEETKKEEPKEEVVGIGKPVKVGDVTFTVHSTSTAKKIGDQYMSQEAQGTYLIADVSVKNEGKKQLTLTNSFFKLKSNDAEYEADSTADMYINDADSMFLIQQINPGNTAKGKIAFDVNDGVIADKNLVMNVQTGFWGTEQGVIKIAK